MSKLLKSFLALLILLFAAGIAWAQNEPTPKKRLKSPATVTGFVGGEAHDSYVIRAKRGQTMTVQITWKREDGNRAEFTVSRSADFFNGEPVKFGKGTNKGKTWHGKIPRTGNYYIYVVAHPTAKYTLKVAFTN